jgi:hypothetical protein
VQFKVSHNGAMVSYPVLPDGFNDFGRTVDNRLMLAIKAAYHNCKQIILFAKHQYSMRGGYQSGRPIPFSGLRSSARFDSVFSGGNPATRHRVNVPLVNSYQKSTERDANKDAYEQ